MQEGKGTFASSVLREKEPDQVPALGSGGAPVVVSVDPRHRMERRDSSRDVISIPAAVAAMAAAAVVTPKPTFSFMGSVPPTVSAADDDVRLRRKTKPL